MERYSSNVGGEPMTPINFKNIRQLDSLQRRVVPHQIDNTGTMFRIRPQTPKLNLLGKKKADKPKILEKLGPID